MIVHPPKRECHGRCPFVPFCTENPYPPYTKIMISSSDMLKRMWENGNRMTPVVRNQKQCVYIVVVIYSFEDVNVRTKVGNIYFIHLYEYTLHIYTK